LIVQARTFLLYENGWVPNNPRLPVILYLDAFDKRKDIRPEEMEALFQEHDWIPAWRDDIYAYHHYHTTTHEALGIVAGNAQVMLGGPDGRELNLSAGEVLIIPAGVGHRCLYADEDFLVVGAYPDGREWDICKGPPDDAMRHRIEHLPLPSMDPVEGVEGLLRRLWHP
jgi:uncharacterized protein YjlB